MAGEAPQPGQLGVELVAEQDRHAGEVGPQHGRDHGGDGAADDHHPLVTDHQPGGRAPAEGRYVAFTASASNLVPGDANGAADVFVRDQRTGTLRRVSVSSSGAQADGSSLDADLSADGRFVSFLSDATNLVPHDTNDAQDVFLRGPMPVS